MGLQPVRARCGGNRYCPYPLGIVTWSTNRNLAECCLRSAVPGLPPRGRCPSSQTGAERGSVFSEILSKDTLLRTHPLSVSLRSPVHFSITAIGSYSIGSLLLRKSSRRASPGCAAAAGRESETRLAAKFLSIGAVTIPSGSGNSRFVPHRARISAISGSDCGSELQIWRYPCWYGHGNGGQETEGFQRQRAAHRKPADFWRFPSAPAPG